MGPVSVAPSLGVLIQNDDNVELKADGLETSSMVTVITPAVGFGLFNKTDKYYLTYKADIGRYADSESNDYEDMELALGADMGFTRKARLSLEARYVDGHDGVGTTNLPGVITPSEWHTYGASGTFSYGSVSSRGFVALTAGHEVRRYDTNLSLTDVNNTDTLSYGVHFALRMASRIYLTLDGTATDVDYIHVKSTQDNLSTIVSLGMRWTVSGKTTGFLKVGSQERDFDSALRDDYTGTFWDASVEWTPVRHSKFVLSTGQRATDDSVTDNLVSKYAGLDWIHTWSSKVSTTLGGKVMNSTFEGGQEGGREDDMTQAQARIDYQMRRWLGLGLGVRSTERSSSLAAYDYKQNVVFLSMKATM